MKKVVSLLLIAAFAAFMVSCQKEQLQKSEVVETYEVGYANLQVSQLTAGDVELKSDEVENKHPEWLKPLTVDYLEYWFYFKPKGCNEWTLLTKDYFGADWLAKRVFCNPEKVDPCHGYPCIWEWPIPLGVEVRVFVKGFVCGKVKYAGAFEFVQPIATSKCEEMYCPKYIIPIFETTSRILFDIEGLKKVGLYTDVKVQFDNAVIDWPLAVSTLTPFTPANWATYTNPANRPIFPMMAAPGQTDLDFAVNNGTKVIAYPLVAPPYYLAYEEIAKGAMPNSMIVKYKIEDGVGNKLNELPHDGSGYTTLALQTPPVPISANKAWAQCGYDFKIKFKTDLSGIGCAFLCAIEVKNVEVHQCYKLE